MAYKTPVTENLTTNIVAYISNKFFGHRTKFRIFASKSLKMSNTFFRFKQFTIHQERCAMKVGTDGVLLGCWAKGGRHILDIGTGTGLIAIMMAQRFPSSRVIGVEINEEACCQAQENGLLSPFQKRLAMVCAPIQSLIDGSLSTLEVPAGGFDSVVSNPPYFNHSLKNPDSARNTARHTDTLSYGELFDAVARLLSQHGEFSAVIPFDCRMGFVEEASAHGLFLLRECAVKTTPRKTPKRFLLAFGKEQAEIIETEEGILETSPNTRSDWYQQLTADFYL